MSVRLSRGSSIALAISIVVMLVVWAPMMALADSSNSQAPEAPPGQSEEAPGKSAEAPGQVEETEIVTTSAPADAGKSAAAPGQNKTSDAGTSGGGASVTGGGNDGSHQDPESSGDPQGKGDGPTTGVGGNNCDGDPSGGSNTGNGANTSGDFDNTCPSPNEPAPNGNGGGGAKGKPCAGCVGNADDKNPPGQSHRPEDNNKGYECDDNKGVGKGNPAHTGCEPDTTTNNDCTSWTLTVTVTNGTASDSSQSYSTLPANFTITATASPNHTTTGGAGGPTTASYTTQFSTTDCTESFTVTFRPVDQSLDCLGHPISLGHNHTAEECSTPPPTCPQDSDQNAGEIIPDGETEESFCNTDDVGETVVCPEGTDAAGEPIPAGEDSEEFCDDDVLGEIIDKDKKPVFPGGPVVAGENLGAPEPKAAVLPFTGGNLLPLLIMSLALMGVGGATLRRRARSTEKEVA